MLVSTHDFPAPTYSICLSAEHRCARQGVTHTNMTHFPNLLISSVIRYRLCIVFLLSNTCSIWGCCASRFSLLLEFIRWDSTLLFPWELWKSYLSHVAFSLFKILLFKENNVSSDQPSFQCRRMDPVPSCLSVVLAFSYELDCLSGSCIWIFAPLAGYTCRDVWLKSCFQSE